MNTDAIPSRGEVSLHTYIAVTSTQNIHPREDSLPSQSHLQRGRLSTEAISQPYFKEYKLHPNNDPNRLKGERFSLLFMIKNPQLIHSAKKAAEARYRKLLISIEEEKLQQYLNNCWKKLRDNFRKFCLELKKIEQQFRKAIKKDKINPDCYLLMGQIRILFL